MDNDELQYDTHDCPSPEEEQVAALCAHSIRRILDPTTQERSIEAPDNLEEIDQEKFHEIFLHELMVYLKIPESCSQDDILSALSDLPYLILKNPEAIARAVEKFRSVPGVKISSEQ